MNDQLWSRSNWPLSPVGSMVFLQNGYPFASSDFSSDGIPLIRIRDLASSSFETFVPHPVPEKFLVRDRDVVIGMDGDFNIVRWRRARAALNQRLCRLRAKQGNELRFVEYALPIPLRWINEIQFATTVKHLSSTEVLQARIPTPPFGDQVRIADFLDDQVARIDNIIVGRHAQLDGMSALGERLVFDQIAGSSIAERRPSTLWTRSLPADWGEPRICQIAQMGTGHTPSRSVDEYWQSCDIPWLTTGDVHKFRHDEVDTLDQTAVQISALGLTNSAAVLHPAGTVALSRTASAGFSIVMGVEMATSQDFATWTCGDRLDSFFLLWALRCMRSDIMGRLAIGSTHKTIYFPDLMSIRVPLPPVEMQRKAVAEIQVAMSDLRRTGTEITRSIELLNELKSSLITAAVTGEFDVSTADGSQVLVGASS